MHGQPGSSELVSLGLGLAPGGSRNLPPSLSFIGFMIYSRREAAAFDLRPNWGEVVNFNKGIS